MTKITYNIYHFYPRPEVISDQVFGEPFKTVTTDNPQIIRAFEDAGKLYVGAQYIGCKVTHIAGYVPHTQPPSDYTGRGSLPCVP